MGSDSSPVLKVGSAECRSLQMEDLGPDNRNDGVTVSRDSEEGGGHGCSGNRSGSGFRRVSVDARWASLWG